MKTIGSPASPAASSSATTAARPRRSLLSPSTAAARLRAGTQPGSATRSRPRNITATSRRWSIPCLRESAANTLLEIAPLASRVVAGYSSSGTAPTAPLFTDDAQEAIEEIAALCDAADPSDGVRAWDAGDWLTASGENTSRETVRSELRIGADTTDDELGAIEARVEEGGPRRRANRRAHWHHGVPAAPAGRGESAA